MKSNRIVQFLTSRSFILSLQVLVSLALVYFVYHLGVLPILYFSIFCGINLCLFLLCFFMTFRSKGKKVRDTIGKILSLLLSILLAILCVFVYKGDNFLAGFGTKYDTHAVSVIVLKDSKIEKVKSLKGKSFAAVTNIGGIIIANAVEEIEDEMGSSINLTSAKSVLTMTEDLYNGDVDAIILNEGNRSMIKEKYPDFNNKTKVIYQVKIKEKIDDAVNGANITKETTTIFISGNDLYDGEEEDVKRSDTNMLVTINPNTKQILMVSVPRDAYVELPSFGGMDKLTHASIYGLNESVNTLSKLFSTDVDYYFRINFSSLIKIVDALGGITVDNPQAFLSSLDSSSGVGQYDFAKGKITLDGKMALIYSRERQVFDDGDNMRGRNQQRVLSAIIKKACSPSIITRYSSLLESINGSFETSLTDTQIKSFIQMQLSDMASWDIQSVQLQVMEGMSSECLSMPGYELYVSYPMDSSIAEITSYIQQMENDEVIKVVETVPNETVVY